MLQSVYHARTQRPPLPICHSGTVRNRRFSRDFYGREPGSREPIHPRATAERARAAVRAARSLKGLLRAAAASPSTPPNSPARPRRGFMAWCALRSRVVPLPASAATAAPQGLLLRFLLSTAAPRHAHHHRRRRLAPTAYAAAAAAASEAPLPMMPRFGRATRHPGAAASVARVYADANAQRPKEYWDYESLDIQWG